MHGEKEWGIQISVDVGVSTPAGIELVKHIADGFHSGYLSTSGVERLISQAYDEVDRLARGYTGGSSQPLIAILESPPGTGKTFLMLRFLEAIRKHGRLFGMGIGLGYYLAPFKSIVEDVARAFNLIVDGYDPVNGKIEPVYLVYRSARDCPHARKFKDVIEKWGSHEIACKLCKMKARVSISSKPKILYGYMRRVIVEEGRGVKAPVVDVLPEVEGQTCLRNLAVQLVMLMPALRSLRAQKIAGVLGSFNAILNPAFMRLWFEVRPKDAPKLMIIDEFDSLITEPIILDFVVPTDLYGTEKRVIHESLSGEGGRPGGLTKYKRIIDALAKLGTPSLERLERWKELAETVTELTPEDVERVCKACTRIVINEDDYCRLCNPLRQLLLISWMIERALEKGCPPVYNPAILAERPECFNYMIVLNVTEGDGFLHITARPVWFVTRLLLDPFYPATVSKVLTSATADIVTTKKGTTPLLEPILQRLLYGYSVVVRAEAHYKEIVFVEHTQMDEIYNALATVNYFDEFAMLFQGVNTLGYDQIVGRETLILTKCPRDACKILSDAYGLLNKGQTSLVFVNSKRNAEIAARILEVIGRRVYRTVYTARTKDFIRVSAGWRDVYITWYRSRISRGVSAFGEAKAAVILFYQSDPPLEGTQLHHMYRQVASTVQSLFRIVRRLNPGRRYMVMPDFVAEHLFREGPWWLRRAVSRRYTARHDNPNIRLFRYCDELADEIAEAVNEFVK